MKILNLYACLGGNRYKWDEVKENIEVTAVELDPELAKLYKERFPKDNIIIDDAHQFLLENYMHFDFIWSSPPCPTHSRARYWAFGSNGKNPVYPDMKLWQEVLFLKYHFRGKWVVENVIPYYDFLIPGYTKIDRHLFWSNFKIPIEKFDSIGVCQGTDEKKRLEDYHGIDISNYSGCQKKIKILRNMVNYDLGKYILDIALGCLNQKNNKQGTLF